MRDKRVTLSQPRLVNPTIITCIVLAIILQYQDTSFKNVCCTSYMFNLFQKEAIVNSLILITLLNYRVCYERALLYFRRISSLDNLKVYKITEREKSFPPFLEVLVMLRYSKLFLENYYNCFKTKQVIFSTHWKPYIQSVNVRLNEFLLIETQLLLNERKNHWQRGESVDSYYTNSNYINYLSIGRFVQSFILQLEQRGMYDEGMAWKKFLHTIRK